MASGQCSGSRNARLKCPPYTYDVLFSILTGHCASQQKCSLLYIRARAEPVRGVHSAIYCGNSGYSSILQTSMTHLSGVDHTCKGTVPKFVPHSRATLPSSPITKATRYVDIGGDTCNSKTKKEQSNIFLPSGNMIPKQ